ncbi:hypothetical protein MUY27_00010 [Mucilaginibacter sp. RS28]|uniref:ParB/Sulfiredoxin domain-containing protein n=1 Tax=Mucilaginibacter straminoryzae TaxID=2932774 RepID=A0A9X2B9T5_9SPHI|nr:hypothetical protein [Mucilaginibacter straminoryzae]MCJ8208067.1 hypothetical protein [Mucilaginibacter straminoryzae]
MSTGEIKTILVTNLSVSTENPRFEMVGNQREAIRVMIQDQGDKLVNLAKDIVEYGLNPSELTIVVPDKSTPKFNVLEGNRRVTALKLLSNLDLIDTDFSSFLRKIKPVSEQYRKRPIDSVQCVVFDKFEDASKWINLKHTGENDGIGIVKWNAQQVARFEARTRGKSAIALQAIEFLRRESLLDDHLKEQLKNVPSTSLERLLRDASIQDVLGLSIADGKLLTGFHKDEVVKGLLKVVNDLVNKTIRVKDIYTKQDREKYIESFKPSELPDKTRMTVTSWELTSPTPPRSMPAASSQKRSVALSLDRQTVIPKNCVLTIKEERVNKIYRELRNLDLDLYENAAAVLLRVFLELSLDTFIHTKSIQGVKKMDSLVLKAEKVIKYLEDSNSADKHVLKGIKTAIANPNSIFSIDTFNAYVHNRHFSPSARELKLTWDNIKIFMEKIWES